MAIEPNRSHSPDYELSVEETEWNRLKEYRLKEGFVGGKSQGEESTLQNGFDHGYIKGFEISYPVSVIKGFLSVNELLLKDNNSILLSKAHKIKDSLKEFEEKCSEFKLSSVKFVKDYIVTTDIHNDNVDHVTEEMSCSDAQETTDNRNQLNEINLEFDVLKEEILAFFKECQQPLLLDQISLVLEKWEYQRLASSDIYAPENAELSTQEKIPSNHLCH